MVADFASVGGAESVDSVGGEEGLKFTINASSGTHFPYRFNVFGGGGECSISFDYYLPSTNTDIDGIQMSDATNDIGATQTTQDAWTSITVSGTLGGTAIYIFSKKGGAKSFTGNGTDVFYIKNLVVTQTTADGAVTTFYDQTGNGNDATNATETQQPLIVDGGTLVEENGKPAIKFDGVDDGFTTSLAGSSTFDFYSVIKTTSGDDFILPDNNSGPLNVYGYITRTDTSTTIYRNYGTPSLYVNGALETPTTRSDVKALLSTGNQLLNVHQGADTSAWSYIEMFRRSGYEFDGTAQEIIIFNSDQSANRTGIEGNIGRYYNIDGFADGFVTELSDQTGNMFDGFNVTAGNQPLVVENGQILTNSFIGYSNDYLFYGRGMESIIGDFYIDIDFETGSDITTRQTIFGTRLTSGERAGIVIEGGRLYIERFTSSIEGGRTPSEGGILANTRYKATLAIDATSSDIYLNGVQSFEANPVNWLGFINVNSTIIGASRPANVEHKFLGKVKTLIVFQGRPTSEHISAFNNYD